MHVIEAPNPHVALLRAMALLMDHGVRQESRNGPVIRLLEPVTTVYTFPTQRVVFHPERDANPFFHLYEALWMLAGRNDVVGPTRYVKTFAQYSDDGQTFHGAYGYRWRKHFPSDQLDIIVRRLRHNPTDRRCVLAMHDATVDLDANTKDQPCNLTATFQRGAFGELNLVVFNRSNDVIWGAYGANAVHFSMLLEYMAARIGCEVGTYHQISVNWHAYLETFGPLAKLGVEHTNPYQHARVVTVPMPLVGLDDTIHAILDAADTEAWSDFEVHDPWTSTVVAVLTAHQLYRAIKTPARFDAAYRALEFGKVQNADWIVAAREWFERREYRQQ